MKKYFGYEKANYQSINHTQQERDDSKKKFGNCYPGYKNRSSYEQNLKCQIIEYKGINNNERITHYFRDLLINIYDDYPLEPTTDSL